MKKSIDIHIIMCYYQDVPDKHGAKNQRERTARTAGKVEKMKDIELLMLDGCTKVEAERHLQRGATVFEGDDLAAHFAEYMQEWGADEEEQAAFRQMLDSKKPLTDWGVVEQDGNTYFIQYVL